mmetsp:Transcript_32686/g.104114  ORF Transcript_32686/g.104114 Transcript_32686/m.104114 type:complete len:487 (+) Transcript_32686:3-1463(+)
MIQAVGMTSTLSVAHAGAHMATPVRSSAGLELGLPRCFLSVDVRTSLGVGGAALLAGAASAVLVVGRRRGGARRRNLATMALPSATNGVVNTHALPSQVLWGKPAAEVLPEVLSKLGCKRAILLVSRSLRSSSKAVDEIASALGGTCVAVWDGMPAHTPREAVLQAARAAREAGADVVVTVGGGSLTDAAKMVRIALQTGADTPAALGEHRFTDIASVRDTTLIPQVTIPTTLSAGEFSPFAGCTDTVTKTKDTYVWLDALPKAIVLDPGLTMHTPAWLFLSTGLRSVDHCVEALCSPAGNPYSDGAACAALTLLVRGLRRVKADPKDVEARTLCQLGIFQAVQACQSGPQMGASHAIGHILGPAFEVPHGYTSCVALPGVLLWNSQEPTNSARQTLVVKAFQDAAGSDTAVPRTAAECVAGLVRELGLPGSLAEVGVRRSQLEDCARRTMGDRLVETNPRKINGWEDALAVLELCGPFADEVSEV